MVYLFIFLGLIVGIICLSVANFIVKRLRNKKIEERRDKENGGS